MKTISILLALVNSLVAGLIIAISLSGNEANEIAMLWQMTKILVGLTVIAISAITWLSAMRNINLHLILLAGLTLAMLGMACAIWTLHLAIVTGDMESYMVAYGGSLILQGIALPWNLQNHSQDAYSS